MTLLYLYRIALSCAKLVTIVALLGRYSNAFLEVEQEEVEEGEGEEVEDLDRYI